MSKEKKIAKKQKKGAPIFGARDPRQYILRKHSSFYLQEAYKAMRTNVIFATAGTEGCKVLAVTSALPSEGKSITALNLAISLAQADYKVLVMDSDLRRPKLARLLNCSTPAGVSNVLAIPSYIDVALLHNEEFNLDVLLAGDIPPNPSELLASHRTDKLLKALRAQYDFIIVDTPPVSVVTDAVVLAPRCDGILFVVRAGQSDKLAITRAMEQLEIAKAKVLGFVLNGVDIRDGKSGYGKYRYRRSYRYGSYGRYGYGYGYGYSHSARHNAAQVSDGADREGK